VADRKTVSTALFELLKGISWGNPASGWAYSSERLQHWEDCPQQPALYVQEGDERWTQVTRFEAIRTWEYKIVVYQDSAKNESNPRPADTNDAIMAAIEAALGMDQAGNHQTLGGLVHSVKIVGTVLKDSGDLDGQGFLGVPIEVIVP